MTRSLRIDALTALPLAALLALSACSKDDSGGVSGDGNQPPQADAGANATRPLDSRVDLDGRASYDPEGEALVYHWSFDAVPADSALGDAESPFRDNHGGNGVTSFQPDATGIYVVALTVDDGVYDSDVSFVIIEVTNPEHAPVADAGQDRAVAVGDLVNLDASQSYDPLGGTLTYTWSLAQVPDNSGILAADLVGASERVATFTPDVTGTYTATLVVDNGVSSSVPDAVNITATGIDGAPVAVVVPSYAGEDCTAVPLDCTGSFDPEDDTLTYFWDVQSRPAGSKADGTSFDDRYAAATTLWADQAGDYIVSCSVFDGSTWSAPATVEIALTERATNGIPDIWAGADAEVAMGEGECVNLGGNNWDCASCPATAAVLGADGYAVDPDGDPLTIEWIVDDGDATLTSGDTLPGEALLAEATPDRPGFCTNDVYEFVLSVTDCPGAQEDDLVRITGRCCGIQDTP